MEQDLGQLKSVLSAIGELNDQDWKSFAGIWKPFSARRKVTLTQAGEMEKYLYFVVEGVQRVYYFDKEGREATIVFMYPPSFGGVLDSFMLQQPSRYSFETLSPSHFLRAPFTEFDGLIKVRPALQGLILRGFRKCFPASWSDWWTCNA